MDGVARIGADVSRTVDCGSRLSAEIICCTGQRLRRIRRGSMTERQKTLEKARVRMLEERDAHAKVLAAPFDREKAERARNKFIELQALIEALDRAIRGEEIVAPLDNRGAGDELPR